MSDLQIWDVELCKKNKQDENRSLTNNNHDKLSANHTVMKSWGKKLLRYACTQGINKNVNICDRENNCVKQQPAEKLSDLSGNCNDNIAKISQNNIVFNKGKNFFGGKLKHFSSVPELHENKQVATISRFNNCTYTNSFNKGMKTVVAKYDVSLNIRNKSTACDKITNATCSDSFTMSNISNIEFSNSNNNQDKSLANVSAAIPIIQLNAKSRKRKIDSKLVDFAYDNGQETCVKYEHKQISAIKNSSICQQNFRKLNMKVKHYCKKGSSKRVVYMRKMKKQKQIAKAKAYGNCCFKCGLDGHWAKDCNAPPQLMKTDLDELNCSKLTYSAKPSCLSVNILQRFKLSNDFNNHCDNDLNENVDMNFTIKQCSPLFDCSVDKQVILNQLEECLQLFGFKNFLNGQKEVMTRILQGSSTLAILPTGSGKSLCYQLPAYLYYQKIKSIALIISPLVALMNDQLCNLPRFVKGACLHNQMTLKQREKVMQELRAGHLCFLLVSAETIMACNINDKNCLINQLPSISFVCIDEAHCIFAWSHHFRPSYLRLCSFLRDACGVNCFLGLTATATSETVNEISKHLGIANTNTGVIYSTYENNQISFSVSKTKKKDEDLLNLLRGKRFSNCPSIIVYCTRRQETEHIATLVRTCLQDNNSTNLPKWQTANCYHAGMTCEERKRVQKAFMTGCIRLIAATVAFGMGLNKKDIRGIIHYNMPSSIENYVQEVGRAGRDGNGAHCHLFLDDNSIIELKRHIVGRTIDISVIKLFVKEVFKLCQCHKLFGDNTDLPDYSESIVDNRKTDVCKGHERAIPIEQFVHQLDMVEDSISTLFCYLELHPSKWVHCLTPTHATCRINCYGGSEQLQELSKKNSAVGVGLIMAKQKGIYKEGNSSFQMPVIDVSDSLGEQSAIIKKQLLQLAFSSNGKPSGVKIIFSDLAFHFRTCNVANLNLDDITTYLIEQVTSLEKRGLEDLEMLSRIFLNVACNYQDEYVDTVNETRSSTLHKCLANYFDHHTMPVPRLQENATNTVQLSISAQVAYSDICHFIKIYGSDYNLTGRTIARIFHGIDSPNFPAVTWGKVRKYWRCHLDVDFNELRCLATQLLHTCI